MSDSERSRGSARAAPKRRATRTPGWRAAARTLLLFLLAGALVAGGAWFWQEVREFRQQQTALMDRLQTLETQSVTREDFDAQGEALARLERDWDATRSLLDDLRPLTEGGRPAWLRAEVLYLLRTAHWNLRLGGEPSLSEQALALADARLAELGDPALLPVRELLADDLAELQAMPRPDIDGMAMRLASMARQSADWPLDQAGEPGARLSVPETAPQDEADIEAEGWRGLARSLAEVARGLVVVRRHDQPLEPLLPPEQVYFQRLNAALHLDAARVALVRRDNALFQLQLEIAQQWIGRYFDTGHSGVSAALTALAEWQAQDIAPERPQLDAALTALQALQRGRGEEHEETPDAEEGEV